MPAPTLDAVSSVRARWRGRPHRRPTRLHADKACDHRRCRRECRARGIVARIARRASRAVPVSGDTAGWVERTFAWLAQSHRSTVRYERRANLHLAFATLACAVICPRQLRRFRY